MVATANNVYYTTTSSSYYCCKVREETWPAPYGLDARLYEQLCVDRMRADANDNFIGKMCGQHQIERI